MRIGQEQHVPDSCNHSLYLTKLFNSSYPEGNFGGNQLLDGSMSLSALDPSITNDVQFSVATSLHQSFPLTSPFSGPVHHLSGPNTYALSQTSLKITVGCKCTYPSIHFHCACRFNTRKLTHMFSPWSVFQDGSNDCMSSETNAKNRTTALNCHFNNLSFERSLFVIPQMREHALKVSATFTKSFVHSELVLTDKANNNADTDMNASATRQSHQAKLVQLTSLPAISGTFNYLFKDLCISPSRYLFAIGVKQRLSFR